jgi:3-oxoacyl-[acyl-carrier protein] reductase
MPRLKGKVACVTGAARGIGLAIAERFAREGANVAVCDVDLDGARESAKKLTELGVDARAYGMNVADEESVAAAVKAITGDFGTLDILVNNAGITRDTLMIRMKKDDWDRVIDINLTGTYLVSKAAIRPMMKARAGTIVNIASVVGLIGNPGQANYAASKAGIIGLTKAMAKEFAGRSITVNAVAPGYIATEMTEHLPDEAKQAFLDAVPFNRPGTPEEVADAVLFLASDESRYITGQVLCVDGGMVM